MQNTLKILILMSFAFLSPTAPSAAAERDASSVVAEFQDGLIAVMKEAEALGPKGRYERLQAIIDKAFDTRMMIRIATGPSWPTASTDQKAALTHAFSHMSASTLAALIDGYSGERFEVAGQQDGPQGTQIVSSRLITSSNDVHKIRFVARGHQGIWKLIDVIVDAGISELRVRMSEYRKTLQDSGVDGLINLLESKGNELLAGAE